MCFSEPGFPAQSFSISIRLPGDAGPNVPSFLRLARELRASLLCSAFLLRRCCRSLTAPVTESQRARFRIASPCLARSRRLVMTPSSALAMTPNGLTLPFGQERPGRAQGLAAVRHRPQPFRSQAGLCPPRAVVGAQCHRHSMRGERLPRSSRRGGRGRWDVRRAKACRMGL